MDIFINLVICGYLETGAWGIVVHMQKIVGILSNLVIYGYSDTRGGGAWSIYLHMQMNHGYP